MKIKFWGVRGSIPAPQTTGNLRQRIREILEIACKKKLRDPDNIENFMENLPFELKSYYGGNTTCYEVTDGSDNIFIIDAGTGLRLLGLDYFKRKVKPKNIHIFLTHFHWDHIQGFPFFGPAYLPDVVINFYSIMPNFESIIRQQQNQYNFPKKLSEMPGKKEFILLQKEKAIHIGNSDIVTTTMNHPGGGVAYSFLSNGKKVCFTGDVEFTEDDIDNIEKYGDFFSKADIAIFDSQYTLEESFSKFDWGHTSYSMAINLAVNWEIKKLILTHHEPTYTDKKLKEIEQMAVAHAAIMKKDMKVLSAYEGLTLEF